ncbi:MAG: sulfotransferase family protein [Chloroflexi bacterium]|nr:sulfotransferase family protein [Chloroflexota bacterium]
MGFLSNLFGKKSTNYVTIVSGLPRSGTSMMMQMLDKGGIPPLVDGIRTPDVDNPKGYYEFERVKKLPEGDYEWLDDAKGKVVKVISALLTDLPPLYDYKIIFMQREIDEVLQSQKKMLIKDGKPTDAVTDEELTELYQQHLDTIDEWVDAQDNITIHYASYNAMLKDAREPLQKINKVLDNRLDIEAMLNVIDQSLYRNRG